MDNATLLSIARTALVNIVSGQVASYSLMGKTYTLHSINDLRGLVNELQLAVNEENGVGSGSYSGISIGSRFVNPFRGY